MKSYLSLVSLFLVAMAAPAGPDENPEVSATATAPDSQSTGISPTSSSTSSFPSNTSVPKCDPKTSLCCLSQTLTWSCPIDLSSACNSNWDGKDIKKACLPKTGSSAASDYSISLAVGSAVGAISAFIL